MCVELTSLNPLGKMDNGVGVTDIVFVYIGALSGFLKIDLASSIDIIVISKKKMKRNAKCSNII